MQARVKVTMLATMIGMESTRSPYTNHRNTPIARTTSMGVETSLVDFDLQAFTTWGSKDVAVSIPAAEPIIVVISILGLPMILPVSGAWG